MQSMSSDAPGAVGMLPSAGQLQEPLDAQEVGNMLYGMQGMSMILSWRCSQCWICFLVLEQLGAVEGSGCGVVCCTVCRA
jgi:hypothetical protein